MFLNRILIFLRANTCGYSGGFGSEVQICEDLQYFFKVTAFPAKNTEPR